jgi:hypothetical protein
VAGKGGRRVITLQKCVHMYGNAEMIAVETVPRITGERIIYQENKYDLLIYCKNFCKCHNVPPPSTIIKVKIFLILKNANRVDSGR